MTAFTNFKEVAEALPSGEYGASKYVIGLTAWYSEKGLYYLACVPWDTVMPSQIATIRGEAPPSDQEEFNIWMLGLKRAKDGFQFEDFRNKESKLEEK